MTPAKHVTDDLALVLGTVDLELVRRALDALPEELFREPCLRHEINAHPHNRATPHALALEQVFKAELHERFSQAVAVCRLLLDARTPVTLGHDFHQVVPIDTYATLLFIQQAWTEPRTEELDSLFNAYVAAGYVDVNKRFPRNHPAFGLYLPLEAALEQKNFPAVRALFRAGCTAEGLGTNQYNQPMEMVEYARKALRSESQVALAMEAMMQGHVQAAAAHHADHQATAAAPPPPSQQRRRANL